MSSKIPSDLKPNINFETSWGAFLDSGPVDWQIFQRDEDGFASIAASGHWLPKVSLGTSGGASGGIVQIRLVREDSGQPINASLDWQNGLTKSDGTWSGELSHVPVGGLYRLETRFNPKGNKLGEWSLRGDIRHFLAVGDLWIIAGQSNASGYGRSVYQDAPELCVHVFKQNGAWALGTHPLQDSTNSVFYGSRETHNAGHSPFLHFARRLKQELNVPIGLIPTALGGSALEAWHPDSGVLFKNLASILKVATGTFEEQEVADLTGTKVAKAIKKFTGMIWVQGETDAKQGLAENYLTRFTAAVEGWRKKLGQKNFPIITMQLSRYFSATVNTNELVISPNINGYQNDDLAWSKIREAQRRAATEIPHLSVVPSLDLSLDDPIHIGSSGNIVLAERFVQSALSLCYGKQTRCLAPEPVEIILELDQLISIEFSNVWSRLESIQPISNPFLIVDRLGTVPISKILYLKQNKVNLFLSRKIEGQVKVSCGGGENPAAMPMDIERQMPALAFFDLLVKTQL